MGETTTERIMKLKKQIEENLVLKDEGPNVCLEVYSKIYLLSQELDRIRNPMGTKENPVRTCKDLYYGHPDFKDGKIKFQKICFRKF